MVTAGCQGRCGTVPGGAQVGDEALQHFGCPRRAGFDQRLDVGQRVERIAQCDVRSVAERHRVSERIHEQLPGAPVLVVTTRFFAEGRAAAVSLATYRADTCRLTFGASGDVEIQRRGALAEFSPRQA